MTEDRFSWLHLTDLHYGLAGQRCLWPTLRGPFLEDLAELHARCGPWDAVLFTGDLVQSGLSGQFRDMQAQVLDPLWERLAELGSGDAMLVAVPGNHDLFRPSPLDDNPAIDTLLEPERFPRIADKFWGQADGAYRRVIDQAFAPYRRVIDQAFAPYRDWWESSPQRPRNVSTQMRAGALPGDLALTIEKAGRRIGLLGLNTAFLQLAGGDYQGKLVWDPHQVAALGPEGIDRWVADHDLCLLLTHHGPDWLTQEARNAGELEIAPAGRFAAHLYGHNHETAIEHLRRGAGRHAVLRLQGCSVFGMEQFGEEAKVRRTHGYAAGQVRFGTESPTLRLWPRVATNKTGRWRYIPDQEYAELENDQGTAPEPVAYTRRAAPRPEAHRPAPEPRSAPDDQASQKAGTAPHSTMAARRPFFEAHASATTGPISELLRNESAAKSDDTEPVPTAMRDGRIIASVREIYPDEETAFTGRISEIGILLQRLAPLCAGIAAIFGVGGLGGVGKTTLALHVARDLVYRKQVYDRALQVELFGLHPQPPTATSAMRAILHCLNPRAQALASAETSEIDSRYREALRDQRLLLVLDNARSLEQVRRLLPQPGDTAAAVVTSRWRFALPGGREPLNLNVWCHEEALAFLRNGLGANRFTAAGFARVAESCGRLPLALEFAVRLLLEYDTWTEDTFVSRLEAATPLTAIQMDTNQLPEMEDLCSDPALVLPPAIAAAMILTLNQLQQEDGGKALVAVWPRFAVFPADFDREAALCVAWKVDETSAPIDRRNAEYGLDRLVRAYLLLPVLQEPGQPFRYRLHDHMKLLARKRLIGNE